MEANKIKMNMDGTFRAKVLQYKSDGNTLIEKWYTLAKLADGIYLSYATPDKYGQVYVTAVFAKNGVFWKAGSEPSIYFSPEYPDYARNMGMLSKMHSEYETRILQAAEEDKYIRQLDIEVMSRLGYDVAPLYASLSRREERARLRAEEAGRRERERRDAEEHRKAKALKDGKKKLMKGECITVEQIELIAEAVGYKINIRTIGFMREKVTEAGLCESGVMAVRGCGLTSRNTGGITLVMRELRDRLKAQAEEEATETKPMCETT